MKQVIACLAVMVCSVLGLVGFVYAISDVHLVRPQYIEIPNYKPCESEYKFDLTPMLPAVGECSNYTWDNVPNSEGTEFGSVTVELCHDSTGKISFNVLGGVAELVYVKGGPGGNLYDYGDGVESDSGLATPTNFRNNKLYGVSHVSFCLVYVPKVCDYVNETAWADGLRYQNPGNWATFTPYIGDELSVTLWAGQFYNAGTVYFSEPCNFDGMVTITIVLGDGFSFGEDGDEQVKVQDYANAPSGNPAPGQFNWKKAEIIDNTAIIVVPDNNFYGVHVDVRVCQKDNYDKMD